MRVVKQINIQNRTYFFCNDVNLTNFESKLLKIEKNYKKSMVFKTLDILQLKKLMFVKIFTVSILCILLLIMETDILRKKASINT